MMPPLAVLSPQTQDWMEEDPLDWVLGRIQAQGPKKYKMSGTVWDTLTLAGTEGGCTPMSFFSEMTSEALGGSR